MLLVESRVDTISHTEHNAQSHQVELLDIGEVSTELNTKGTHYFHFINDIQLIEMPNFIEINTQRAIQII